MLQLKTKWFNKWAKKNIITDKILLYTLQNISDNLGAVELGGCLYKARVAKKGQGRVSDLELLLFIRKMI